MLIESLREEVCEANLELKRKHLVVEAFGNVSGIDRERGLVAIKPSGADYARLTPSAIVVTDLDGRVVEGSARPSSDLPTHLVLYRAFLNAGGIAHTHSTYATSWAQAGRDIPCLGTTHADYFPGAIPVTAPLVAAEIENAYEENTGHVIVRAFESLDATVFTAVLVHGHAPFCWAASATEAARTAFIVEEIARLALHTITINAQIQPLNEMLRDKHFYRKHGSSAYYGQ